MNICVVGPKTAESLEQYGLRADLIPQTVQLEGVLDALGGSAKIKGLKLYHVPKAARELIPDKLREWGAEVTVAS